MEAEKWRSVDGFEGLYEVSNLGRVRSLPRKTTSGKILKQKTDKDGYLKVNLVDGSRSKHCMVHRLVAQAFIENPLSLPVVNHKDENKQNNVVDNLEFCSVKYNTNYNGATKRRGLSRRRSIDQYDISGNHIARWSGRVEVEMSLGYHGGNITSVCRGKRKSAYGFIWRYSDE